MAKKQNKGGSEFDSELEAMNSAWSEAPESNDLPEGVYTMTIQSAEIKRTKTSGKLRATFQYVVSEGEHEGASQYDGFMLDGESPVGMSVLKQLISKLGYEVPADFSEVNDVLSEITNSNPIVSAQIVRKGDFTNVRVVELLDGAPEGDEPAEDDEEEVEDADESNDAGDDESGDSDDSEEQKELAVGDKVSLEVEGSIYIGTISKIRRDGTMDVETDEEVFEEVDPALLTPEDTDESNDEDADEDKELKTAIELATAHDIEGIDDDTTKKKAFKILGEAEWDRSELTDEEIEFLTEVVGVELPEPKKAKPVAKAQVKPASKKPTAKPASKPVAKKK